MGMILPRGAQYPFDLADGPLEAVSKVLLVKYQDSPAGRFESFVTASVTKVLGLKKVMSAVVLDGQAAMTVAEIGRR